MQLRQALKGFVQEQHLCPPVSLKQLEGLATSFVAQNEGCKDLLSWLMVEIHNQIWLPVVASIPHERRLLMLPKCLSRRFSLKGESERCQAEFDEFGLLCHRCGCCHIPMLQDKAELLGSLSIVAEGFTQVVELIENQVVDAVIGVSCLDSLQKAFPLLVRHAVPGLAVALNNSGCHDTHVDMDYVEELLSMLNEETTTMLLNHEAVREQVNRWFTMPELEQMLFCDPRTGQPDKSSTSRICLDWMCGEGKRWRPFLLSAVWQALTGKTEMTEDVHRAAVAVECFHKASLIHDDVEDQDSLRYGQPTVNALYGDAFAINAGDALLGEGYRILAQSNNAELLRLIADAHMKLSQGQGEELMLSRMPEPNVDMEHILHIFRLKTVPAFEVSLMLGLSCTGNFVHIRSMLTAYSEALGIAYQLKDDLEDFIQDCEAASRPSAVMALRNAHPAWTDEEIKHELQDMVDNYHQQALDALSELDELELKRLLYQVTEEVFK